MSNVEGNLANLSLEDSEEEEAMSLGSPISVVSESLENCFAGLFFTTSVVSFQSM